MKTIVHLYTSAKARQQRQQWQQPAATTTGSRRRCVLSLRYVLFFSSFFIYSSIDYLQIDYSYGMGAGNWEPRRHQGLARCSNDGNGRNHKPGLSTVQRGRGWPPHHHHGRYRTTTDDNYPLPGRFFSFNFTLLTNYYAQTLTSTIPTSSTSTHHHPSFTRGFF